MLADKSDQSDRSIHTTESEMLQILLLGTPCIHIVDQQIDIPRRQVRALLYRLAAHMEPVPREQLAYLFWPDSPESDARRNLRRLLTCLRQALPLPEMLIATNEHVMLNPELVSTDSVALDHLRGSADINQPHMLQRMRRAIELYQGRFLDGFVLSGASEYDAWLAAEQAQFEQRYLDCLKTVINDHMRSGRYDDAIENARRYLVVDDLAEDIHCQLMLAYAAKGDRAAAVRQFSICEEALARELGVEAAAETRMIADSVRERQGRSGANPVAAFSRPPGLPGGSEPTVAPGTVMHQLLHSYEQAHRNSGHMVLVSGDHGLEYSCLLHDFMARLPTKTLIGTAVCRPTEQHLSLFPVIKAIERCLPDIEWERFQMEPSYLSSVVGLLPALSGYLRRSPMRSVAQCAESWVNQPQQPVRSLQALAELVRALARHRGPLVLVLEDLHWADPDTLAWLGFMTRRAQNLPFLVVASWQPAANRIVSMLAMDLARNSLLREIAIPCSPAQLVLAPAQYQSDPIRSGSLPGVARHIKICGNMPIKPA